MGATSAQVSRTRAMLSGVMAQVPITIQSFDAGVDSDCSMLRKMNNNDGNHLQER
jgi:hypothetical protein